MTLINSLQCSKIRNFLKKKLFLRHMEISKNIFINKNINGSLSICSKRLFSGPPQNQKSWFTFILLSLSPVELKQIFYSIQELHPPTSEILFKNLNSLSVTLVDCSSSSCFQCR